MVSGIDDENVTFFDGHFFRDHFRCVETIVFNYVGDINNNTFTGQIGQRNIRNGAHAGMESTFTNQVGTNSIAPIQDLSICTSSTTISTGQDV